MYTVREQYKLKGTKSGVDRRENFQEEKKEERKKEKK